MADLSAIAGVIQVFFGGQYEGTINDFGIDRPRSITSTGMANGHNARGVGIEKPTITFSRPVLKVSKGQQVSIEILDGPIDIDIILPGSDQQWRCPRFIRANSGMKHNPDAGNTSENYSGVCDKPIRIK